jgi:hypothetical protein
VTPRRAAAERATASMERAARRALELRGVGCGLTGVREEAVWWEGLRGRAGVASDRRRRRFEEGGAARWRGSAASRGWGRSAVRPGSVAGGWLLLVAAFFLCPLLCGGGVLPPPSPLRWGVLPPPSPLIPHLRRCLVPNSATVFVRIDRGNG